VTGTGIAPVLAMLYALADMGCNSHIAIYFGARNEAEVFEVDTLQQLSTRLPRMTYTICFSQQAQLTSQHAVHSRVTSMLDKLQLTDGAGRYQFFLCGNPNMVAETYEMLINKGINKTSIFREKFTQALSLADSI
jgi:ferredoxin-NADP reductase